MLIKFPSDVEYVPEKQVYSFRKIYLFLAIPRKELKYRLKSWLFAGKIEREGIRFNPGKRVANIRLGALIVIMSRLKLQVGCLYKKEGK